MGANKENKIDVKNIIKESAVVLVLVAIIIVFSFLSPQFFKVSNFNYNLKTDFYSGNCICWYDSCIDFGWNRS